MEYINPSTETVEHALTGGNPDSYATIGNITVVVNETYNQEDFTIVTPAPEGQEIIVVNTTDIMLTSAPKVVNDETAYFMEFTAALAVLVMSTAEYHLLQQTITFRAHLGLMSVITPPANTQLPVVTLSAINNGFTAKDVTSIVTVDTFSIPVGESKSIKVALNANKAISNPVFADE